MHVHPGRSRYGMSGVKLSGCRTYTGMVVDICTASAVSATLILRYIWGPWLDEGPNDVDSGTEPSVDPNTALLGPAAGSRLALGTDSFSAFLVILDGSR